MILAELEVVKVSKQTVRQGELEDQSGLEVLEHFGWMIQLCSELVDCQVRMMLVHYTCHELGRISTRPALWLGRPLPSLQPGSDPFRT